METKIYIFRNPSNLPWGDYGSILYTGMTMHQGRNENGLLQLERTGPFVPPIVDECLDIVATDDFKLALETSGLKGFAFKPVIKKRIVYIDWETWDQNLEDPQFYPESGEPADYILERPHSDELAEQMGELWELCLEQLALVEKVKREGHSWKMDIYLLKETLPHLDFFRAKDVGYVYLSENAKNWLEENYFDYVEFKEAKIR
ncbi:MAG: hypothetical protein JEZ00_17325 [Anaerolineaceae bacterium]|nr:hypothetical protein [Anaerolineaceae bacterium]